MAIVIQRRIPLTLPGVRDALQKVADGLAEALKMDSAPEVGEDGSVKLVAPGVLAAASVVSRDEDGCTVRIEARGAVVGLFGGKIRRAVEEGFRAVLEEVSR